MRTPPRLAALIALLAPGLGACASPPPPDPGPLDESQPEIFDERDRRPVEIPVFRPPTLPQIRRP